MRLRFYFCLWLACYPGGLAAQQLDIDGLLESMESEDITQTDFLTVLQDLRDHPLSLNQATAGELLRIPFLDTQQVHSILRYRKEKGLFESLTGLLAVTRIDAELLAAIRPYLRLNDAFAGPVLVYRVQAGCMLTSSRGYREGVYHHPWRLYQRLRWQPQYRLLAVAVWEKDAGEADWADFGSLSLSFEHGASAFLLGDFNLSAGHGLMLTGAYGTPVSLESPQSLRMKPLRWRAKSDVDENAFLRGALWAFSPIQNMTLLGFISRHALDATLIPDSAAVQSFYGSGLHRTPTETAKRDRVRERLAGAVLQVRFSGGEAGLAAAQAWYDRPLGFLSSGGGSGMPYLSGFYALQRRHLQLSGEATMRNYRFPALHQQVLLNLQSPRMVVGGAVFYYHPDYWAAHGRSLGGISDVPADRVGMALQLTGRLPGRLAIAALVRTERPLRSWTAFAFRKRTYQLQLRQPVGRSQVTLRWTRRVRMGTAAAGPPEAVSAYRLHLRSPVSGALELQHRIEFSYGDVYPAASRRYGVSFYQAIRYRPRDGLQLQLRWTQFEVPDFSYRLYEYESDLPGNFRNALLNGRGTKWFALVSYNAVGKWRLAVKFREVRYPDRESLGSGLDEIPGNRRREVRAQLELRY